MTGLADKIDCTSDMDRKMSVIEGLVDFIHLDPELPDTASKTFNGPGPIEIQPGIEREEIVKYLGGLRSSHRVADLAFYASRDLSATDWQPFLKAALERNPACIKATKELDDEALLQTFEKMPNESIYDGSRVAQPDEVWNFQRGDGIERAITLANIWLTRHPGDAIVLTANGSKVTLKICETEFFFESSKGLEKQFKL